MTLKKIIAATAAGAIVSALFLSCSSAKSYDVVVVGSGAAGKAAAALK